MSKKRRDSPKAWSKRRRKKKGQRARRSDPKSVRRLKAPQPFDNELDQVGVLITEEQVGIARTEMEGLEELASSVPFEQSAAIVARLAGSSEGVVGKPTRQLDLAKEFFGENELTERFARQIEADPKSHIFGAQSLQSLLRILIEQAPDAPVDQELDEAEILRLMEAVLASNSITERGIELGVGPDRLDLLAYEIQIGSYYARPPWMEELSRARRLFNRLTSDPSLLRSADAMPFADLASRGGLTIEEQWKLGFGFGAIANAWDENGTPYISPSQASEWLQRTGLESRSQEAIEAISATREQFRQSFGELNADGARFIWEMRPFNKWPFLRLENDNGLLLLTRPSLVNWLSDGFYYRAHEAARADDQGEVDGRHDHVQRLTSYWGKGYEAECLDLAKEALSSQCTVEGEQRYGRGGGLLTSDVAVLCGTDLVLFEVNGRMTAAEPLVSGSQKAAEEELKKQLVKKIDQLGVSVDAVLSGNATIPGVEIEIVKRVIPVAVTTGRFWQTQTLWDYLDGERDPEKCSALEDTRVLPPQLLRVTEFETLLAMCFGGMNLGDLLALRATGKYRHRDFAALLKGKPSLRHSGARLPSVKGYFESMIQEMVTDFGTDEGSMKVPTDP